jgi:hypothetical protein
LVKPLSGARRPYVNPSSPLWGTYLPYDIILAMSEKKPAAKNQPPKQPQQNTIEGDCIVAEPGYLILMNVIIKGTKHVAEAQLLYIPHHRISFAHTVPTKVEKIEETETQ